MLDELEKAGGDSRYGVMNSLLSLLERYTAKKFKDECIPLEIDASYIVWFATANDLDKLTAPIKSRFDIFSVPNPTPTQRKSLIKGIYNTVRENNSWGHYFEEKLPEESLDILATLLFAFSFSLSKSFWSSSNSFFALSNLSLISTPTDK